MFLSTYVYLYVANNTLPSNHLDNLSSNIYLCRSGQDHTHTMLCFFYEIYTFNILSRQSFLKVHFIILYCISFETEKQCISFFIPFFFKRFVKMIKSRKIFSVWFHLYKKSMILKMGPNLKYFLRFNQLYKDSHIWQPPVAIFLALWVWKGTGAIQDEKYLKWQ